MNEQTELQAILDHEVELARERAEREARIERERVEQVFRLGGGELESKPWYVFTDPEMEDWDQFLYHYDGAPEYYEDRDRDGDFHTVVSDVLYGSEPKNLYEKGARYVKVAHFLSSGETECPLADEDSYGGDMDEVCAKRPCEYCEAQAADDGGKPEPHGHIYLGDGWAETIYQRILTCADCGTDLTCHEDYGDDRCLKCNPYEFEVTADGYGAYDGGSDVVYAGSNPEAADLAFALFGNSFDVELTLHGKAAKEATGYSRGKALKERGIALLRYAESGGWDHMKLHRELWACYAQIRKPWDDHEARAWVESRVELFTGAGPDSWVEWRMYYEGGQVESRSSLIGAGKVPPGGWSKAVGVHVWKRTGKVYSWGDEKRQAEIAAINADFAAQYAAWREKR